MLPDSDLQIFLTHHHVRLQESVHQGDTITNFKPSLMVATAFLATVFLLTVLAILYFKFCHGNASSSSITSGDQQEVFAPDDNVSLPSGLDRKEIQSLPFFRFGVLRGSREGLECSVCLSTYEDTEILRLLPKCRHAFHVNCVDQWLSQHDTCPLCRSQVVVNDAESNSEDAEGSISNANRSSSGSIASSEGVELFVEREEEELGDQDSKIQFFNV